MEQRYAHPPIIQAVVEFRFARPDAEFQRVSDALREAYPMVQEMAPALGQVAMTGPSLPFRRFVGPDLADEVTLTLDSLAIVRNAPYLGWPSFEMRVRRELERTKAIFEGRMLARLGVRMVNRIDVDCDENGMFDHRTYLNVPIDFLSFEHGPVGGIDVAISTVLDSNRFGLLIRCAKAASPLPGKASIILDLDVYNQLADAMPKTDDELWSQISKAREWKNTAFEALITDRSRDMFA